MSQDFATYKAFWDHQARDRLNAMLAVDGSGDDEVLLSTGQYTADQVVAALDLQPADRVLELGCGVGRIGSELAKRIGHWHGVDISQKMIDLARDRMQSFANASVDVLERTRLDPAVDESLDKAYSVAVFIHMDKEDLFLYLQDLYRALKPGGRIYFDTWNISHPVGFKRFAYEVGRFRDQPPVARKDVARNQFSCPQEIEIYLQQAGFEVAMMLADSPWIQAVAVKPGGDESLDSIKEKLVAKRDTIIYGAGWTEFFDRLLQTIFEGTHPQALYDSLRARAGDREADMFATWLRGFWKLSQAQFGPAPSN